VLDDGTAAVCCSPSVERDGHGSIGRLTRVGWIAARATVPPPATLVDVALGADAVLVDVALAADAVLVGVDRGDPPQPVRHAHPITAITDVQRIRLDRLSGHPRHLRTAMSSGLWSRSA
jgi:hypothetical protein